MSGLPWDNNSWEVAAQIAARRPSAAALGATTVTDTPLPLRTSSPPPQLQIKTIIVPGQKTIDGQLVEAVALPWFDIVEILRKDPSAAFQIDPRTWEEIVAGAYKKAGFDEVTLTRRSGDLGRDVIAIKKGLGTVRVIDQVKAFGPTHLVPAEDVRASRCRLRFLCDRQCKGVPGMDLLTAAAMAAIFIAGFALGYALRAWISAAHRGRHR
jgi:hypothetical protein